MPCEKEKDVVKKRNLVEGEGFEPSVHCCTPAFQASKLNRSDILPRKGILPYCPNPKIETINLTLALTTTEFQRVRVIDFPVLAVGKIKRKTKSQEQEPKSRAVTGSSRFFAPY